ncbi:hypothetical protein OAT71_01660 [Flavobacteriales bacterium]|nr:hypothetical protein [Flavobacteriales bacterium]
MRPNRIRNIEVLELADKFDQTTANLSIELANWLNATLSFTLIHSVIDKRIEKSNLKGVEKNPGEVSEIHSRKKKLDEIQQELLSLPLELGFDFLTIEDQTDIKDWLSVSSSQLIIITADLTDTAFGWRASLISHIHRFSKAIVGIAPSKMDYANFHTLVVPYHFDSLSDEKLKVLKWFVEQMGLLVDFVHVVTNNDTRTNDELTEQMELAMDQIESYFNNNLVKFYFPRSSNVNEGIKIFLNSKSSFIVAFIDDFYKNAFLGKSLSNRMLDPIDALTLLI